jgi:regulator of sirC expression with transglutaminase-like and TPR domain
VDPTERFTELLQGAESDIALDEACFLIAAHARPELDVGERRAQLDALAASLDAYDADALAYALFTDLGYAGNTIDYADPDNSYLDAVLDRRLGIPITLSVLMIEVGRRRGIEVHGVGMPGHFLVGVGADQWYDPFYGGVALDYERCVQRFAELQDPAAFRPAFLAPVGPIAILDRMLANLQHSLIERAPARAVWPTRLRLRIPGISPAGRAELASLLGSLGHFSEAATELDTLARDLPGSGAEQAAQAAARFRARAN